MARACVCVYACVCACIYVFFPYKNFIRKVICVFENWLRYRVSNFPPRAHGKVWGLRLNRGSSFRVMLESKRDLGFRATRDEICCIVLDFFFN